jgi:hypothetical protein
MEYVFSLLRYDLDAHNEDLLRLKERLKYSVLDDEKEDLKKDIIKLEANRKSILKALKILNSA